MQDRCGQNRVGIYRAVKFIGQIFFFEKRFNPHGVFNDSEISE